MQNFNSKLKIKIKFNKKVLAQHKVMAMILFGSQITGYRHPQSDIDVGIIFKDPRIHIKQPSAVYGDLYEQLAPIAKAREKLDIVYLDEAPISLRFKAVEQGEPLYIKDNIFFANYREKTMREYFDFKPVTDEKERVFMGQK